MARTNSLEKTRFNGCKLSPEQVYMVLTRNDLASQTIADMLGVSVSNIRKIRRGETMKHLHPDLPRHMRITSGPTCSDCVHDRHGRCTLGFPERDKLGGGERFATKCPAYMSALARG